MFSQTNYQVHGSQAAVGNSAHQQCFAFVFLLIYSGQSISVHFGPFTQPCHWLKRLHLAIRWGKTCFLVILQCTHPNYLFQWMKPLLKVLMFLQQSDKA